MNESVPGTLKRAKYAIRLKLPEHDKHAKGALTNAPYGTICAMPGRLVTTTEAAKALGVSNRTLARWARDGRLTPTERTLGGHLRWDLDDLREQIRRLRELSDQESDTRQRGQPS